MLYGDVYYWKTLAIVGVVGVFHLNTTNLRRCLEYPDVIEA